MVFVSRTSELESVELENYQISFVNIKDSVINHDGIRGVCMDNFTQNIFITVVASGKIFVYSINGRLLYNFGSKSPLTCLRNPWYSLVSRSLLYVSDYSADKVSIYTLEGDIITSFEGLGRYKNKFKRPNGMLIEPSTGDFYICDTDLNRIQWVHDLGLYVTTFGENILSSPHEIKLSHETLLILSNGRIYNYSLGGMYLSETKLAANSVYGYYFEVGENNGIIISDGGDNIYLLDTDGKVLGTYNRLLENKERHLPCIMKCNKTHIIAIRNLEYSKRI